MPFKSYRKESKDDWGTNQEGPINLDQINTGAILRIADATEAMAKNHVQLIEERDRYVRWYNSEVEKNNRLANKNKALKGVITKLKKKLNF